MLIYNFSKEFIGIDANDLKVFGFSNLAQLRAESADFADLFVRTPGYVHNFQHVHWIDFILSSETTEQAKVIISVNGKTFTATIVIATFYLTDRPTSKAYQINFNNLRELNIKERDKIAEDINNRPTPKVVIHNIKDDDIAPVVTPTLTQNIVVPQAIEAIEEIIQDDYDLPLDIDFDDDEYIVEKQEQAPIAQEMKSNFIEEVKKPEVQVQTISHHTPEDDIDEDDEYAHYVFDPKVASDELGLPVDLIEEFIQDFIAQAKEFKPDLYAALNSGDFDNVKILSHKLKGVAANLRIEDALSNITTVNISKEEAVMKKHLDRFYRIISRLAGETVPVPVKELVTNQVADFSDVVQEEQTLNFKDEVIQDDEDFVLDFKDNVVQAEDDFVQAKEVPQEDDFVLDFKDEIEIQDSDVPLKIDMPELADDDFLANDVELDEYPLLETLNSVDEEEIKVDYSKKSAANAVGLDYETFNELFNEFVEDAQNISIKIHQAISEDDFKTCKRESLLLKGMSEGMQIKSFNSELESLIATSDKDIMTKAMNKIDKVIKQISK
jgi:HPt (histidine-containing phosphotransfer) domain-containing protein